MKLNNRGISIIEIVVTFALIMVMIISMFTIVMNYRYKASVSIEKLNMDTFKNTLTNDIQKDISSFGVDEINLEGECLTLTDLQQCVNIVFKNGKQKAFGTSKITVDDLESIENKYFYYDGIKYKLRDDLPDVIPEERSAIDFQKIKVEDNNLLSKDSAVLEDGTVVDIYSIDVFVSHVNFDEDFGIHIVATTEDISIISHDVNITSVKIDGKNATSLPVSGTYVLSSYKCKLGSTLTWDMYEKKLTYSDFKIKDECSLEFKSSNFKVLLLDVAKQGDYIAYEGNNGCKKNAIPITGLDNAESGNSCLGYNANETIDNNANTYGYCATVSQKITVQGGWRIAYKDSNNAYLVSAGIPECNVYNSGVNDYIELMNTNAKKYCNTKYVDGNCSDNSDVWAINAADFKQMNSQYLKITPPSDVLDGLSLNGCINHGAIYCGSYNDLLDIGSGYAYASKYNEKLLYHYAQIRGVDSIYSADSQALGLRPIIKLSSNIYITGGFGTIDNPYMIDKFDYYFTINDNDEYTNSLNVSLKINGSNINEMCISNTENCTDYVTYSSNKNWVLNSDDGTKIVYVYLKLNDGSTVNLKRSIILDTTPPTNNKVKISEGDGLKKILTLESDDAKSMCISDSSNLISDCTNWIDYEKTYNWRFDFGVGEKIIYAFFKDHLGNATGSNSASYICSKDCDAQYFMKSYDSDNIYLMRSDGATALVTKDSSSVTWYTPRSQYMYTCTANSGKANGQIWCIGEDSNAYYKNSYNETSWNKLDLSDNIDISLYDYFITGIISDTSAAIVRNDGLANKIGIFKTNSYFNPITYIENTTWKYGAQNDVVTCSGYSSSIAVCLGKDNYYYLGNPTSSSAYSGGKIMKLTGRTKTNSWLDFSSGSVVIIESDNTNLYSSKFNYWGTTADWYISSIPGGGVKTCSSMFDYFGEEDDSSYCLCEDGYMYYKNLTATTWTKSLLNYK